MSDDILIVDDDDSLRRMMEYTLQQASYKVRVVNDGDEALAAVRNRRPRLIITDVKMQRIGGFELLTQVRQDFPEVMVIMVTAFGSVESAVRALQQGAHDYLVKPFSRDALRLAVDRALSFAALQQENKELRQRLDNKRGVSLLTESPAMQRVLEVLDRVADAEVTVLLRGESGTGKELLAQRLHQRSSRADKPFVAVNCAAIPHGLIESELFGHVKGSFTGALKDRKGKFEQADGGTLFLDEIGELPLDQQPKLLRALQLGEIEPVGGEVRSVNVRVVAATHIDVEQAIADGRFREDLYYRLAVIPLTVPPLRQRPEDIALLARYFLRNSDYNRSLALSATALAALQSYSWPGNVRELQNLMQRLALLCTADTIELSELPESIRAGQAVAATPFVLPASGYPLEELEKSAIVQALQQTAGNQSRAAELLHIPRHVLLYRLEKYGLKVS